MRGIIDEHGRYRERSARGAAVWLVLVCAVVLLLLMLMACAEPPTAVPAWRASFDSMEARAARGVLAIQDTGVQLVAVRQHARMADWPK